MMYCTPDMKESSFVCGATTSVFKTGNFVPLTQGFVLMTRGSVLKSGTSEYKTGIYVFIAGSFDIKTGRSDMMTNSFVTVTNRSVSNASIIDNKTPDFDMMLSRLVFVADAFV